MIHLDTNFVIRALVPGSDEDKRLRGWLAAGESIKISAIAWAEFQCGPLTSAQAATASVLLPSPVSFDVEDAVQAAALFNSTGRRRGSFGDCMIAATAIRLKAPIARQNKADFKRFEPFGLQLAAT